MASATLGDYRSLLSRFHPRRNVSNGRSYCKIEGDLLLRYVLRGRSALKMAVLSALAIHDVRHVPQVVASLQKESEEVCICQSDVRSPILGLYPTNEEISVSGSRVVRAQCRVLYPLKLVSAAMPEPG